MRTRTHFSLQLLGLVTVLLTGTMTSTGCQGCIVQPGMSPEGWCCRGDEVFPCIEHECYDTGGAFFPTEHEAVAHCGGQMQGQMPPGEGWCCDAGNVMPCSEAECHGWGGIFFLYEHEAIAHCQGSAPGPSPPGAPVIHYFTANPSTTSAGQTSTLKWDVSGTGTVSLTGSNTKFLTTFGATDQEQVSPMATEVYTLTATNSAGTVTDTATVTVTGSAPPGGGGWSGPPKVTNVTANAVPPSYTGPGPTTINFVADITVDGPCTVTYKWERSDGVIGLQQTLVFSAAGAQQVSDTWTLGGGPGTGIVWERVSILTPLPMLSNKAQFTLNITP